MGILRIEELTYGVEDIDSALRFCADFGLEPLHVGAKGGMFRTGENQIITVVGKDEAGLPPKLEDGTSVRRVTWGVDNAKAMEAIGASLQTDREVQLSDGAIRAFDETGFAIAFCLAEPQEAPQVRRQFNFYGAAERMNHVQAAYGRARPYAIAHVVFDLPKEGRERAIAFYVERLNFRPTEIVVPTGAFLQCEGSIDHHQLFLCHRTNRAGLNHTAFEVRDFDELIEGGNYLAGKGWKEVRPMGRHTIGSNMYRFFGTPCGRFEYSTDMDKVAKTYPNRVWEEAPPHHLWAMKGSS